MNIIVGILIGVINDSWSGRLVIPFIYGLVYCGYEWVVGNKLNIYIENVEKHKAQHRWGISHIQAFYFIEYFTATITSLLFSLLTGLIKNLLL
ncbi:MAG: hypothetical protein HYV51_00640 [Parcubacteria group bacterium]|nr:hypothetical protein [Parcubacteria group bacterium]